MFSNISTYSLQNDRGAPRPFIVVGGGHTGAGEGEMAGGNGLNAIDGGPT
jgi:hypothetical protein